MRKTRELSRYLGVTDDLRVVTSSGSTTDAVIAISPLLQRYFSSAGIAEVFAEGIAEATGNITFTPVYYGSEVFDSSHNPRPAFNNCWHLKNRLVNLPYTYMVQNYSIPTRWIYGKLTRVGLPTGSLPHVLGVGYFEEWDAASRRAWWTMQPRFEGEVSMLNFLFELKDFKDIAKHMLRLRSPSLIGNEMRTFLYRLRGIDRRIKTDNRSYSTLRKIVDTGASATKIMAQIRLFKEFALQPLINDWCAIMHQAGQIVREVQLDFQQKGLAEQVRHYSEEKVIHDSLTPGTKNNYYISYGYFERETFTATLDYKYNYSLRSPSDAFLSFWGLKFTPEVIWNAVPFSFLADYFVRFGSMLHAMKVDPNVKVLPSQYCESLLRTYSHGYCVTGDPRAHLCVNGLTPRHGSPLTGYTGSLYVRRVKPPNKGLATPIIKLPSGRQGGNMAALAICFIK